MGNQITARTRLEHANDLRSAFTRQVRAVVGAVNVHASAVEDIVRREFGKFTAGEDYVFRNAAGVSLHDHVQHALPRHFYIGGEPKESEPVFHAAAPSRAPSNARERLEAANRRRAEQDK